ncbi:MAG: hypothetical protein U0271_46430 [Polyangiaceae bacterium]
MKVNIWKVSTVILAGALTYVLATSKAPEVQAEPQPHMKSALAHLTKAQEELEAATADKGGHRALAIKATKEAIEETQKGIDYDNKK